MDFLILFLLALGFWWYAGRVIDDVLDGTDAAWWRALSHEDIARHDYGDVL